MVFSAPPSLVSIITPFADASQLPALKLVQRQVEQQLYPCREWLIVTPFAKHLDAATGSSTRIVAVPAGCQASELRNAGILAAAGDWCCLFPLWQFQHPARLLSQMACRRENYAVTLSSRLRLDCRTGNTAVEAADDGLAETILFPRSLSLAEVRTVPLYPVRSSQKIDEVFLSCFPRRVVLSNLQPTTTGLGLSIVLQTAQDGLISARDAHWPAALLQHIEAVGQHGRSLFDKEGCQDGRKPSLKLRAD